MAATPEIIPMRCGTIRGPVDSFETGSTGDSVLPVYAYLITHPTAAPVLFDTGLHPDKDGRVQAKVLHNEAPAGQDVVSRLRTLGVAPRELHAVVLSHAHYDHAGGLPLLGDAPTLIHRDEDASRIELSSSSRRTGETLDIFGDGSVEVFATPGHSPGHQSLRVRRFGGYDVLAGDSCYFCRSLDRTDADQPHAFDKPVYQASKRRLAAMRDQGDFVIPGHDEGFLDQIPEHSAVRPHAVSRL